PVRRDDAYGPRAPGRDDRDVTVDDERLVVDAGRHGDHRAVGGGPYGGADRPVPAPGSGRDALPPRFDPALPQGSLLTRRPPISRAYRPGDGGPGAGQGRPPIAATNPRVRSALAVTASTGGRGAAESGQHDRKFSRSVFPGIPTRSSLPGSSAGRECRDLTI